MFASQHFASQHFAPQHWPPVEAIVMTPPPEVGGGGGSTGHGWPKHRNPFLDKVYEDENKAKQEEELILQGVALILQELL